MRRIFVLLLVLFVLASTAFASDLVTKDLNVTYVSKYIWRGFDLNANQPALQPGIGVGFKDIPLTLSVWGSLNVGDTSRKEFTELDVIVDYAFSFQKGIDYSIGYTFYTFPNLNGAARKSGEIYLGAAFNEVSYSPAVVIYYDHDQGNGLYATLSGSYDFVLGSMPISSSVLAGYNGGQWGANSGMSDIAIAFSSSYENKGITFTPSITYIIIPTGTGINPNSSELLFGVNISL